LGVVAGAILAYLLGSMPFGYWVARARGVDIQKVGSGNIGATNVLRALGPRAAVPVLTMDVLKGFFGAGLASWTALAMGGSPSLGAVAGGLAAFAGHNWSFLLRFTGGRGVATGAGAALYIMPGAVALGLVVVVVTVALTRYVSLGSLLGAASVATYALLGGFTVEEKIFAVLAAAVIVYKHRPNIGRLLAGTESKFGQRVNLPPAAERHGK
jgi:glycerol-3-phosphate acyltransferase PlsY